MLYEITAERIKPQDKRGCKGANMFVLLIKFMLFMRFPNISGVHMRKEESCICLGCIHNSSLF